jgi:hypothetical protein
MQNQRKALPLESIEKQYINHPQSQHKALVGLTRSRNRQHRGRSLGQPNPIVHFKGIAMDRAAHREHWRLAMPLRTRSRCQTLPPHLPCQANPSTADLGGHVSQPTQGQSGSRLPQGHCICYACRHGCKQPLFQSGRQQRGGTWARLGR